MNWYKIAQILEKVRGKVSPVPSWQREDKVKPIVEEEIYPEIKWPYDKSYIDIGHEPSEKNHSYMWYMTIDSEIVMKEVKTGAESHQFWDEYKEDKEERGYMASGRYETDSEGKNGVCSIGTISDKSLARDNEAIRNKMFETVKTGFPAGTKFIYFGGR